MNMPVIDLHILGRLIAIHEMYCGGRPALWAAEFVASARPVLQLCAYDGPDVTDLYAGLDAIDRAIAQTTKSGHAVIEALRSARESEVVRLAAAVSSIIRAAKRIGEQEHDEEAAKTGTVTHLETRLRASVAIGELPAHGGTK